jgi:hypothetical protein
MPSRKFAVTVDYSPEQSSADVREWIAAALAGAAEDHRLVVESVGSHCYGYILKGVIEVNGAGDLDAQTLTLLLRTPPGSGPKLTLLRLL